MDGQWLTYAEAAEALGVTPEALRRRAIRRNWARQPAKLWLGYMVLLSAHHFLNYAKVAAGELEEHCRNLEKTGSGPDREPQLPAYVMPGAASA